MHIASVLLLSFFFLTLVGTMIQGSRGLWWAQEEIFHTWIAWLPICGGSESATFSIPFPGVLLLGAVAIINLSAALLVRFPWKWRNSGLLLMHFALLLLLISGAVSYRLSQESYLKLAEGQKKSWSSHSFRWELALQQGEEYGFRTYTYPLSQDEFIDSLIQLQGWPEIKIQQFETNARVMSGNQIMPYSSSDEPETWKPALKLQISDADGKENHVFTPDQSVLALGPDKRMVLRHRTEDLPFAVELISFTQEKHHGTMVASSYHSHVKIYPQIEGGSFAADITMNQPLRMGAWTLYQSSYANWQGREFSILAVVKNPVKIWPWYATILMGVAMLLHMAVRMIEARRKKKNSEPGTKTERQSLRGSFKHGLFLLFLFVLCSGTANTIFANETKAPKDWRKNPPDALLRYPIWHQGRLKPMESYSRHVLLQISGKSSVSVPSGGRMSSEKWLFQMLLEPENVADLPLVLIESPELRDALGLKGRERDRYSWSTLRPLSLKTDTLAMMANLIPQNQQAPWQLESMRLAGVLRLLQDLENSLVFLRPEGIAQPVPHHSAAPWGTPPRSFWEFASLGQSAALFTDSLMSLPDSVLNTEDSQYLDWLEKTLAIAAQWSQAAFRVMPFHTPSGLTWESPGHLLFLGGYRNPGLREVIPLWNDLESPGAADSLLQWVKKYAGSEFRFSAIETESIYHRLQPFYKALILYFLALIPALIFGFSVTFRRNTMVVALVLLSVGLFLHLVGMGLRVHISLRPPVTNLYETFVFVGSVMVLLFLGVFFRLRWKGAPALAAFSGAALLMIARRHGVDGDTLPVLAAVLDSNFWLSIHVITITLGYGGVLAAGVAAHVYLWNPQKVAVYRITRGLLAFGLLLTFIGTLLGGIWADQSWGRFWGWDPKENGALLIVLWCAFAFHGVPARWFGAHGFALASVASIPVVLFAWFGVNLMGVGLHSYGFTTGTLWGLIWYAILELLFVVIVLVRNRR